MSLPVVAKTAAQVFPAERPHPVLVVEVLDSRFPLEWPEWDTETLGIEVERELGVRVSTGGLLINILGACQLLRVNDFFWEGWEVFNTVAATFNGYVPNFRDFQALDPGEMAVAMHVARGIREAPYSVEIQRLIASSCMAHGLYFLPPPYLSIAQAHVVVTTAPKGYVVDVNRYLELYADLTPASVSTLPLRDAIESIQLHKALVVREMVESSDSELVRQRGAS